MPAREAWYLIALLAGIVCLVAAVAVARRNRRPEIAPFGRRTHVFRVLVHPDRYALPHAVRAIRALNALGLAALGIASALLAMEAVWPSR